ncbi:MAG: NifB/NifX family molybdenum-iron cluster-binding protein [Candidatus Thermoplasmatota archaeon]|nr:NifB/NifX family molybdenum-iron cluster-binding protein [Candidatus Thermoplasmatota archaeon]MBS3789413.1 NifB/NifX family molybdenum-iron cluster-binding protein [Candidatus Thermoplasmatota archaeon]
MKIAMPTMGNDGMDEQIGQHFGRVPTFTIYDLEKDEVEVIENQGKHRGGSMNPPEILAGEGVDVMLCSNLGRKAIDLFDELGIDVYCGAGNTVREALEAFEKDELEVATLSDGCEEGSHDH